MAVTYSAAARTAQLQAVVDLIDAGTAGKLGEESGKLRVRASVSHVGHHHRQAVCSP
jgi:hypothetical protein